MQSCRSVWCSVHNSVYWLVCLGFAENTRMCNYIEEGVHLPQEPQPTVHTKRRKTVRPFSKSMCSLINLISYFCHRPHISYCTWQQNTKPKSKRVKLMVPKKICMNLWSLRMCPVMSTGQYLWTNTDAHTFLLVVFWSFSSSSFLSFSPSFGEPLSWSWSPLSSSFRLQLPWRGKSENSVCVHFWPCVNFRKWNTFIAK